MLSRMSDSEAIWLIKMVEERPQLWDKSLDSYKDGHLKQASWKQICKLYRSDYDDLSHAEKEEINRLVASRWNNLRDNWVRYFKKILEHEKNGDRLPRKYIFFDNMKFLIKVYGNKDYYVSKSKLNAETESSLSDEIPMEDKKPTLESLQFDTPNEMSCDLFTHNDPLSASEQTFENKRKYDEIENRMEMLEREFKSSRAEDDPNSLFFSSIMPSVAQMNEEDVIEFRLDVLNSIKRIRSKSKYNNNV